MRKPYFVPEHKKINDLLGDFQTNKVHMAIVVDEYGSTLGLVSLEDIIEEIVGEISDESDNDERFYERLNANAYLFDGKAHIGDFERVLSLDEDLFSDVRGKAETLAGLMLELKRDFPRKGDTFTSHGIRFTVQATEGVAWTRSASTCHDAPADRRAPMAEREAAAWTTPEERAAAAAFAPARRREFLAWRAVVRAGSWGATCASAMRRRGLRSCPTGRRISPCRIVRGGWRCCLPGALRRGHRACGAEFRAGGAPLPHPRRTHAFSRSCVARRGVVREGGALQICRAGRASICCAICGSKRANGARTGAGQWPEGASGSLRRGLPGGFSGRVSGGVPGCAPGSVSRSVPEPFPRSAPGVFYGPDRGASPGGERTELVATVADGYVVVTIV